jgi:uncharacterized protein YjdB
MKYTIKQILTILCLLVATGMHAQTIERKVINSMGGNLTPGGGPQLTHNLGETFSTTLVAGGYSLTQGFLQYSIVSVPPINGTLTVCVGATTALTDSMSGGTWFSSNTSVATVGSTGVVTGVAAGTSTISYTVSGSSATAVVTVNGIPSLGIIEGSTFLYTGDTITLSNSLTAGTWSSSNTSIAVVNTTGRVIGISPGSVVVSYSKSNSCGTTVKTHSILVMPGEGFACTPSWKRIGHIEDSIGQAMRPPSMTIDKNGIPYVAFWDGTDSDRTKVFKYVSGEWQNVGVGNVTGKYTNNSALAVDYLNRVYIAFADEDHDFKTCVRRFNGTSWEDVGPQGFSFGAMGGFSPRLAFDTDSLPVVVITDGAFGYRASVMKYNGSIWDTLGVIGEPLSSLPSLSIGDSGIYVASSNPFFMRYFGGVWTNMLPEMNDHTNVRLPYAKVKGNQLYVAYQNMSLGGRLSVQKKQAGVWSYVGAAAVSDSIVDWIIELQLGIDGTPFVAYNDVSIPDHVSSGPTLKKYDGNVWRLQGQKKFCMGTTEGYSIVIDSQNIPSLACVESMLIDPIIPSYTFRAAVYRFNADSLSPVIGLSSVCVGDTIYMTNAAVGGLWTTSDSSVASISSTGMVIGHVSGIITINYSLGSCSVNKTISVNTLPTAGTITGPSVAYIGSTITLSNAFSGGIWSSANNTLATIGSTGIFNPLSFGIDTIKYTLANSCGISIAEKTIAIYLALPCYVPPAGLIAWYPFSGNTIDSSGNGNLGTNHGASLTNDRFGNSNKAFSFNGSSNYISTSSSLIPITGDYSISIWLNSPYSSGTYTEAITQGDAYVNSTYLGYDASGHIRIGGSSSWEWNSILYPFGSWHMFAIIKKSPYSYFYIDGNLTDSSSGYTNPINSGSTWIGRQQNYLNPNEWWNGKIDDIAIYNRALTPFEISQLYNAGSLAGTISGLSTVCTGSTISLTDSTSGGTWSSSNTSVATVGSTGVVSGIVVGTATISYTVTNACGSGVATKVITVTATPSAGTITGSSAVCAGSTITLSNATSGGSWSSSNTAIATVGSTGVVTGVANGTVTISYTVTNSCGAASTTKLITVNAVSGGIPTSGLVAWYPFNGNANDESGYGNNATNYGATLTNDRYGQSGKAYLLNSIGDSLHVTNSTPIFNGLRQTISLWFKLPVQYHHSSLDLVSNGVTYANGFYIGVDQNDGAYGTNNYIVDYIIKDTAITFVTNQTLLSNWTNIVCVHDSAIMKMYVNGTLVSSTNSPILSNAVNGNLRIAAWDNPTAPDNTQKYFDDLVIYNRALTPSEITQLYNAGNVAGTITGSTSVCTGSTTTLTDSTTGGTWSSSNTSVATIGSTGVVTGISAGTATISYTVTNTCGSGVAIKVISVTATPAAGTITGSSAVCAGSTITLSNTTTGGSWSSSNTAVATVGSMGIVAGVANGTATISYSVTNSCGTATATKVVTVNAIAGGIPTSGLVAWYPFNGNANDESGNGHNGVNNGAVLSVDRFGNTNSSFQFNGSNRYIELGSSLGLSSANGLTLSAWFNWAGSNGITDHQYIFQIGSNPNGSIVIKNDSTVVGNVVNCNCASDIPVLSPGTSKSTWHHAVLTYDLALGTSKLFVDGVLMSTTTESMYSYFTINNNNSRIGNYHWGSHYFNGLIDDVALYNRALTPTEVTQLYNAGSVAGTITGSSTVCTGSTITLTDSTAGGTWSSSNTSVATVGSTGVVTGVTSGTATISYTVTNACGSGLATKVITVNPTPTAGTITGSSAVCAGSTITLSNATSGGSWSSSNTAKATVGSTGVVTGVASGTVTISYTVTNSCGSATATKVITVNAVIGGIPTSGLVAWYPFNGNAIDESGNGNNGTSYGTTLTTDRFGIAGKAYSFNGISDSVTIPYVRDSQNFSVSLWIYTSNFSNISYPIGLGINPFNTVDPYKGYGIGVISDGSECGYTARSLVAFDGSSTCSNAFVGSVVTSSQWHLVTYTNIANTGILYLNGVNVGTSTSMNMLGILKLVVGFRSDKFGGFSGKIDDIAIYNRALTPTEVTQLYNAGSSVSPITGSSSVYVGATITLADSTASGSWSSSNTAVATVGSTGVVTGVAPGTVTISYTVSNACGSAVATKVVTVNSSMSSAITGTLTTCIGATTTLSNTTTGGTWASSTPAVATIGSASGVVTGVSAGTSTITYTVGGSYVTAVVSVYAMPAAITGGGSACINATIALACATTGGSWSSSNTATASVGATGIVTGVAAGTAVISYTISGSCSSTKTITINVSPSAIAGSMNGCIGITNTLTCTPAGGAWASGTTSVATINTAGQATGFVAGTTTISYTLSSGCRSTATLTINTLPDSVGGTAVVCAGLNTALTGYPSGGNWSSSNVAIATIGAATGVVNGIALGTSRITYSNSGGCYKTKIVTVNAAPLAITGTASVCIANTTTLACPGGGTWSSSNTSVATIGSTGVVTGVSSGTSTITYRLSTGCINTRVVTVNGAPTAITGTANICAGTTTTLTSTPSGGTWTSSGLTVATIGSVTGVVTAVTGGVATMSYTMPGGCRVTKVVTVNNNPPTIGGTATLATGGTTTLTNGLTGGTWSSGNTSIATVGTTGLVSGIAPGTAVISYTAATGCFVTKTVTVSGTIGSIVGTTTLCTGTNTTLTCSPTGGVWSSSNTSVATVTSGGLVTGITAGTATISYTISGTTVTAAVTVYTMPAAITGTGLACIGADITLATTSTGGNWSSANTAIATVGSTGIVTGVTSGTTTISYTVGGACSVTRAITVNSTPSAIGGTLSACEGAATTLSCSPTGGAWSSSAATTAGISADGTATGVAAGTAMISYTLATGCRSTAVITINALPAAITGTLSICEGASSTLSSATTGGSWSSSNTSVATIGSTGVVSGNVAGTTTISYSVAGGCGTTAVVTVQPTPMAITGPLAVCEGNTGTLTNATTGGTWVSDNTAVATVGSASGVVNGIAAGTATVTYTVYTGCSTTAVITVNAVPGSVTGTGTVCAGGNTTLSCTPSGGVWSTTTSSIATVGSSTGVVTGVSTGTAVVTYSAGSGCYSTTIITVNPVPASITGTASVCEGQTTTLTNTTSGGTWSSDNILIVTVNSSGVVFGVAPGTTTVSYTLGTGCYITKAVTVNTQPAAITGSGIVCTGANTTFSCTTTGGTWSSGNTTIATTAAGGVVTGVATGVTNISYTIGGGCVSVTSITVNQTPAAITGSTNICPATSTALSSTTTGGTWSSANTATATVNSTGLVTGVAAGTVTISYTTSGCYAVKTVTVNALPSAVSGGPVVCSGITTALTATPSGGTWSSSNTAVGTVNNTTGNFTGLTGGTTTMIYKLATGCQSTAIFTVNPSPAAITGGTTVCLGTTLALSSATSGGTWSSSNTAVATISSIGVVTGVVNGTATISYTTGSCAATKLVTVNTLFTSDTTYNMCLGNTKVLVDPVSGGTWASSTPSIASVVSATGLATAYAAGMTTITYSFGTGCSKTTPLYVQSSSAVISGPTAVCEGSSATMSVPSGAMGGGWTCSNTSVAVINMTTGIMTGVASGTVVITYTLIDCYTTKTVTINPRPAAITGAQFACVGNTTTLSNTTTGGAWSSSNTAKATVSGAGLVTGVATGTATISYTLSTGCSRTAVVTVSGAPAAITGTTNVCVGNTITLASTSAGGTWSSSDAAVAGVDAAGIVSGTTPGVATISYGYGGACTAIKVITVNPTPGSSTGESVVCGGQTITLSNALTGGTWSSSNAGVATANSATGVIAGVTAGTVNITYAATGSCRTVKQVTVNAALPAITGGTAVCVGSTVTLSTTATGGAWSSSVPAKATIDGTTGIVTGVATGSTTITYTVSAGCFKTSAMLVNPAPAAITGASSVVVGSSTTLACATTGGAWSSSNTAIGTVGTASGAVTGISAGTMSISYTIITTGCRSIKAMTVNPTPLAKGVGATENGGSIKFAVYPNPTQGTLTVETSVAGTFRIFTIDSKLLGTYRIETPSSTIQLPANLASGIYMCQFSREDGTMETVRLIYQQ